ncbi:MAG: FAD-dependent oxidoreductase, partial [Hyphomicrobiaceae bacterium]
MSIQPATTTAFEWTVPVLIVGAGAAGLVAALAACEQGADVVVLERDAVPRGSTALSAGLIPAAGTRWQRAAGIVDNVEVFAADIMAKAAGAADPDAVTTVTHAIAPVLEGLADRYGLPFSLVADFSYPGHSARRMHGLPGRSGEELIGRLREAAAAAGAEIVTNAHVVALYADDGQRIHGVAVQRPDGSEQTVGCATSVLACGGYGGNKALVARHIPELAQALYFGHAGNRGDALLWGQALGAATRHLAGHQAHGSVAHPHGILIAYATITEGGFQVNTTGLRFSNEIKGYSEQAAVVTAQPGGVAYSVFDGRIAAIARQFEDFRRAEQAGAVLSAATPAALAAAMGLDGAVFAATFAEVQRMKAHGESDRFGRPFAGTAQLAPPYHAVKVTGALFHTQGGLVVDGQGRVLRENGTPLPNLFAAGGAAAGVSGNEASGYLSGNGLLTALAYGYCAGRAAAASEAL